MANNTLINSDHNFLRILFLDAQIGSGSSDWFETTLMEKATFHLVGIEPTATIQIMGRNDLSQPASTTDGPILITLNSTVQLGVDSSRPRWIKVKKNSAAGAIASTVIMEATR